jgi:hypothetical protein
VLAFTTEGTVQQFAVVICAIFTTHQYLPCSICMAITHLITKDDAFSLFLQVCALGAKLPL